MPLHPLEEELSVAVFALGERAVRMWQVGSLDALMDRALAAGVDIPEDDIPYFACVWPTARVLATHILGGPRLDGVEAWELGCGMGLSGLAAAMQGAHVTLTDLQPAALELAERNAREQDVAGLVKTRLLDWRTSPNVQLDLLIASDVLYEARMAAPLAQCAARMLAPKGVLLLADPSRPHFPRFLEEAATLGLLATLGPLVPAGEGGDVRLCAVGWHPAGSRRAAPWELP